MRCLVGANRRALSWGDDDVTVLEPFISAHLMLRQKPIGWQHVPLIPQPMERLNRRSCRLTSIPSVCTVDPLHITTVMRYPPAFAESLRCTARTCPVWTGCINSGSIS